MKPIDKDALIAEIEKLRDKAYELYGCSQFDTAYNNVLKSIDTIEIKEVDKNDEIISRLNDIIKFHKEKVLKGKWYKWMPEKISYHNGIISGIKQCLSIIGNK